MKFPLILLIIIIHYFFYCIEANETKISNKQCQCSEQYCGCCVQLQYRRWFNGKLCAKIFYVRKEYGISLTVTFNNITVVNKTLSAKNPPPICVIHLEQVKTDICLHFYKLDMKKENYSGCLQVELSFFHFKTIKTFNIGCFSGYITSTLTAKFQNVLGYLKSNSIQQNKDEQRTVQVKTSTADKI